MDKLNTEGTTLYLFSRFGQHSLDKTIHYDPTRVLAKAAREARLGTPLTTEHICMYGGFELVYQFFFGGLAWCVRKQWDQVYIERW